MSSAADVVQLMKTQEKILTELEKVTRYIKNKDPGHLNGLQVLESSKTYTITGRIDPFLKRNLKVYFSEDDKYLIVDASHETSFDRSTASHNVMRKFRIEDKYDLNSMDYQIIDNVITITIEVDRSFCEREEAPEEQGTRKKKGRSMRAAADRDLDMIETSEGELLPRYVVERTTIDPEILQRKIELPPDLYLSEICEAYIPYREDELEPCPEFERLLEELSRKKLEEKLAEKKALATHQSASVPQDTDTTISREKPVDEDMMESEKEAAEQSGKQSGVQSQEIAEDGDGKRLKEKTESEKGDETQKESSDQETEGDVDVEKTIEESKKKTDDEKQPETALKEEEREIPPEVSKQQPDEGEEADDKESKKTVPETPPRASKQDEGDKTDSRETTPGTSSNLPLAEKPPSGEKAGAKGFNEVQVSESSNRFNITGRIDPCLKHSFEVYFSEDKKHFIVAASETSSGRDTSVHKMERKFRIEDKYNLNSVQYNMTIDAEDPIFSEREEAPEEQGTRKKKGERKDPNESEETSDKGSKVIVPDSSPKVSKQQPDEGEETDDKVSKETVPETPPKASKQQTDEGDKADSRETTPGTSSNVPTVEEKHSGDRGGAKGIKDKKSFKTKHGRRK